MSSKLHGRIKWFDQKKGYGFVTGDDGKDYFFHYTAIQMEGFKTVDKDEEVDFEAEETAKGLQAVKVYSRRSPESR
ncbi:MAG: cold-shock protein [bacterium JZ-2024 1]